MCSSEYRIALLHYFFEYSKGPSHLFHVRQLLKNECTHHTARGIWFYPPEKRDGLWRSKRKPYNKLLALIILFLSLKYYRFDLR